MELNVARGTASILKAGCALETKSDVRKSRKLDIETFARRRRQMEFRYILGLTSRTRELLLFKKRTKSFAKQEIGKAGVLFPRAHVRDNFSLIASWSVEICLKGARTCLVYLF